MIKEILIFATGVVTGAIITNWANTKTFNERIAKETKEFEDALNTLEKTQQKVDESTKNLNDILKNEEKEVNVNKQVYQNMLKLQEYREHMDAAPVENISGPYIIHPDKVGEKPGYTIEYLTYYEADDTLAVTDSQEIVDDILGTIGEEAYDSLDENEMICVRNDDVSTDYEIDVIHGSYKEDVSGIIIGGELEDEDG